MKLHVWFLDNINISEIQMQSIKTKKKITLFHEEYFVSLLKVRQLLPFLSNRLTIWLITEQHMEQDVMSVPSVNSDIGSDITIRFAKMKTSFSAWLRRRQASGRKYQSRSRNGHWPQRHGRIFQKADGSVQSEQFQKSCWFCQSTDVSIARKFPMNCGNFLNSANSIKTLINDLLWDGTSDKSMRHDECFSFSAWHFLKELTFNIELKYFW